MTNEEILNLKKAVNKAKKCGYVSSYADWMLYAGWNSEIFYLIPNKRWYYSIIFSHEFCKAFWGEEIKCHSCDIERKNHRIIDNGDDCFFDSCSNCGTLVEGEYAQESWKNHIAEMVLEEEPLKYLEKFL
jgi:hypothetical protein